MSWKLVLSDIHANWPALRAVLEDVERLEKEYPVDEVWFCGDLIGYGPHAFRVMQWAKEQSTSGFRWVIGNHDAEMRPLLKASYESLPDVPWTKGINRRAWYSWRENLRQIQQDPSLLEWFAHFVQQERRPIIEVRNHWIVVTTHGALYYAENSSQEPCDERLGEGLRNALTFYVYPWEDHKKISGFVQPLLSSGMLNRETSILIIYGHTHIPTLQIMTQTSSGWEFQEILMEYSHVIRIPPARGVLINPGSVGQPRDGDRRASYALLNPEENLVLFRRVEYPVDEVLEAIMPWGSVGENLADYLMEAPIPQRDHIPEAYRTLLDRRRSRSEKSL